MLNGIFNRKERKPFIKLRSAKETKPTHCLLLSAFCLIIPSCDGPFKNDYYDNSPTSGKLKVYFNEGLEPHITNQAYTFMALYHNAEVECKVACEGDIVTALLNDSCKAIVMNRLLGENEKKAFAQKQLSPKYSALAKTGVALIINSKSAIKKLTVEEVKQLLSSELNVKDSAGKMISLTAVLDSKCSSSSYYLRDSLLGGKAFGPKCFAVNHTKELLDKIAEGSDQIGFLDFAWLSDIDDSLYKAYEGKIKFLAVGRTDSIAFAPNQSSFKTGDYPFTRTIYLLRRSDNFSLATGFEAFMAGPKGQVIFLKQGLLPARQQERAVQVKFEPINAN
jgi:phosphate transport system substrate-binding protein